MFPISDALSQEQKDIIELAHEIYGEITPCRGRKIFDEHCFSDSYFWFNKESHSTSIMSLTKLPVKLNQYDNKHKYDAPPAVRINPVTRTKK